LTKRQKCLIAGIYFSMRQQILVTLMADDNEMLKNLQKGFGT
jgi:hypothetical protein